MCGLSCGDGRVELGGSRCDPLEPWCHVEPLENLARLGQARLLPVLKQCGPEPKRGLELAEAGGRRSVAGLVSVQPRTEAVCLCLEVRRPEARREVLDRRKQLCRLCPLAERECRLDCLDKALLHELVAGSDVSGELDARRARLERLAKAALGTARGRRRTSVDALLPEVDVSRREKSENRRCACLSWPRWM